MKINSLHSFHVLDLQLLVTIFIICFGLFLRTHNWRQYPFNFDQVQIANASTQILLGKPTLIGPRTGPAEMFTGPLIYYLAAVISVFVEDHIAVIIVAVFLSLVTGLTILCLGKFYFGNNEAIILTSLWAFSPFLVHIDRIPWNPNLSVLAAVLVLFPLLGKLENNFLNYE